jgi:hypothetical protein
MMFAGSDNIEAGPHRAEPDLHVEIMFLMNGLSLTVR